MQILLKQFKEWSDDRKKDSASASGIKIVLYFLITHFYLILQNCGDCTFDTNCGYCFIQPESNSNDLAQNASCVQINTEDPDFAKYGRCSKNLTIDSLTFAGDYCPSNNSWMIGMVAFLM